MKDLELYGVTLAGPAPEPSMNEWINLKTARGPVQAWRAQPAGTPRGGLVVVQEIFGVNAHIRSVAERFAGEGYLVLAPAFFDLVEADVQLDYGPDESLRGRELATEVGMDAAVEVVSGAAERLRDELGEALESPHMDVRAVAGDSHDVGCIGYCWGGTVALRAAQVLALPSVSYYGARDLPFLDQSLRAPVMFHFGENDPSIPPEAVQAHRDKLPNMPIFTYPAKPAFNRDASPDHYDAPSAALAWSRSLDFLREHVG